MERAGNGSAKIDGCPRQNPAYRPDCTQNRRVPTHSVGTRRFFCCSGLGAVRNGYHPGEAETQRGGKMKGTHRLRRLLCLALAVGMICTLTLAVGLAAKQRRLAGKLIRLHVVASSDAPDDQARKLLVRDAVLPVAAALTDGCADADAARRRLAAGLPELETAARSALRSAGSDEPVRVSLGSELFPRRDYPTFSLPAGPYTALRVTVGAGSGHNWWCVAFPALCLPATTEGLADAAKTAGLTGEEVDLITGDSAPVRLKFRALEWLAELFG